LDLIIVPATQGHFFPARQELAIAQTACRAYKNALARPSLLGVAETMIKAYTLKNPGRTNDLLFGKGMAEHDEKKRKNAL
jgi:hypothetical protein